MSRDWEEHYALGETPWDTGQPSSKLVELSDAGRLPEGRALDVGCGTGASARYLARRGYDVLGVDVVDLAVQRAREAAAAQAAAGTVTVPGSIEFRVLDFLADEPLSGPFDLVFDRGCFHVFDQASDQARFAERVAACLAPEGLWVSLIGSTEGPPRDSGPPRRSARDVVRAVEPALEIVELQGIVIDDVDHRPRGWVLMARPRVVPAQPSTT